MSTAGDHKGRPYDCPEIQRVAGIVPWECGVPRVVPLTHSECACFWGLSRPVQLAEASQPRYGGRCAIKRNRPCMATQNFRTPQGTSDDGFVVMRGYLSHHHLIRLL